VVEERREATRLGTLGLRSAAKRRVSKPLG